MKRIYKSLAVALLGLRCITLYAQTGTWSDLPFFFDRCESETGAWGYSSWSAFDSQVHCNTYPLLNGTPPDDGPLACAPSEHPWPGTCWDWPPLDGLQAMQEAVHPYHTYPAADTSGNLLDTQIRFLGDRYRVCQYHPDSIEDGDTLFAIPWTWKDLPRRGHEELIWAQGVMGLAGMVEGRITVLCSDSVFIVDNLITADTDTSSCGEDVFGLVPYGSPNRVGLVGMGPIILEATHANGFGRLLNEGPCAPTVDSNVQGCYQEYRDLIVSASLIALGCSITTEYWITSRVPGGPALVSSLCDGELSNRWIDYLDCGGTFQSEFRGTFWFCGSIAAGLRGHLSWLNAGYMEVNRLRYDPNLLLEAPPGGHTFCPVNPRLRLSAIATNPASIRSVARSRTARVLSRTGTAEAWSCWRSRLRNKACESA